MLRLHIVDAVATRLVASIRSSTSIVFLLSTTRCSPLSSPIPLSITSFPFLLSYCNVRPPDPFPRIFLLFSLLPCLPHCLRSFPPSPSHPFSSTCGCTLSLLASLTPFPPSFLSHSLLFSYPVILPLRTPSPSFSSIPLSSPFHFSVLIHCPQGSPSPLGHPLLLQVHPLSLHSLLTCPFKSMWTGVCVCVCVRGVGVDVGAAFCSVCRLLLACVCVCLLGGGSVGRHGMWKDGNEVGEEVGGARRPI